MKKVAWVILSIAVIGSISSLIENNLAVLFFSMFWLFLGYYIIRLFFKRTEQATCLQIFLLFYFIYYVYALVVAKMYINNPRIDYFINIDSFKFYSFTDDLLISHKYLIDIYKDIASSFRLSESTAFYYLSATIGFAANILGANSYFVQQLVIVFMTAFIPVFLYRIAILYFDKVRAKKIAVTFGLFTHIFVFSATLLRDIHIAFLFIIAFYLLLSKKSFKNLFFLLLIWGVVWFFRVENGIFFICIIGFYILFLLREQKRNPIKLIVIFVIIISALGVLLVRNNLKNILLISSGTTNSYSSLAVDHANKSGLGLVLLKLPHGIREVARVVYSQLTPFPVFAGFNTSLGVFKIMAAPLVVAGVYWFITWWFLLYGLFKKSFRKLIPYELKVAFFCAILLIVAASLGAGDLRRLMCVYPIMYLVAAIFYYSMPKVKRTTWLRYAVILYIGLHLVYAKFK